MRYTQTNSRSVDSTCINFKTLAKLANMQYFMQHSCNTLETILEGVGNTPPFTAFAAKIRATI